MERRDDVEEEGRAEEEKRSGEEQGREEGRVGEAGRLRRGSSKKVKGTGGRREDKGKKNGEVQEGEEEEVNCVSVLQMVAWFGRGNSPASE